MKSFISNDDYESVKRFEDGFANIELFVANKKGKEPKKIYVNWAIFDKTYRQGKVSFT